MHHKRGQLNQLSLPGKLADTNIGQRM